MQDCSIYVHWPFCRFKCPYCDFNSHVRDSVDQERFLNAYLKELHTYHHILQSKRIKSIFFGGGTPSLAPPKTIGSIIEAICKYPHDDDIEITLEANPTSVESKKFEEYAAAGINRISIGIQSFNTRNLKFLGRQHDVNEAKEAISIAAKIFDRYTFDLMYAMPNQTIKEWQQELTEALRFVRGHISLYQLTIEKGTAFYSDVLQGKFNMPRDALAADFYDMTQGIMEHAGMPAYEVSNHASVGQASIHNMNYWEYGNYIGIGAGAHSRYSFEDQKIASVTWHQPEEWLSKIEATGNAIQKSESLSQEAQYQEKLIMRMRLAKGIPEPLIQITPAVSEIIAQGFLEKSECYIRIPKHHRLLTNSIIQKML